MGRHADEQRKRGVAAWPIVTGIAVLVIGGLIVTYFLWLRSDSASTSNECTSAHTVQVVAGTEAAPVVTELANEYNATGPQARGACLTVAVTSMESAAAGAALAQGWGQPTPAPSVWIPDNSGALTDLTAAQPTMTAGMNADPFASSPVVLAMTTAAATARTVPPTWTDLPSDDSVLLGLADPAGDPASLSALESVLAVPATEPVAITTSDVTAGVDRIAALAAGSTPVESADQALADLAAGTAAYTAVPVLEKDLAAFNTANADALQAIYPVGPTAGSSLTAIGLAAAWVDATAQDGASAFISYLSKDEAKLKFQQAGFRVPGLAAASAAHGIDPSTAVVALPGAVADVTAELSAILSGDVDPGSTDAPTTSADATTPGTTPSAPETEESTVESTPVVEPTPPAETTEAVVSTEAPAPTGPVITFVVDASAGMSSIEDGQSLTGWSQAAVSGAIASHPDYGFGLFNVTNADGAPGYTQLVPTGQLTDPVGAGTRADALTAAIAGLSAGGTRWTYAAVINAYQEAVNTAVAGRANKVIMIIDGPDLTPNTPREAVIDAVTAANAQGKGVQLHIIGLGSDPPAQALTEITAAGGGTYTSIPTASQLPGVIETLMAAP